MKFYSLAAKIVKERDEYIESIVKDMSPEDKELYLQSDIYKQLMIEYDISTKERVKERIRKMLDRQERVKQMAKDLKERYKQIVEKQGYNYQE